VCAQHLEQEKIPRLGIELLLEQLQEKAP